MVADRINVNKDWGPRGTVGASIPSQLVFESVWHSYQDVNVLRGIDVVVEPGEVVSLLGPSGCGKTTLLRVAAGIERVKSGRVILDGKDISSANTFVAPENRGIGMMFQDYALFPHLTVAENVAFGLQHLSASDALGSTRRALSRVGLDSKSEMYPHMLSGGEQQRVALARTVAPRPGIILMDEPFSNLDRRLRDRVREETISLLRELGATTLIVTHDPEEAMRISDRIALMRDGIMIQIGTGEELYSQPCDIEAARFFFDFTELNGQLNNGIASCVLGNFEARDFSNHGNVIICVRPAGVQVSTDRSGIPARILSQHFLGEVFFVEFGVQGLERSLKARLRPQDLNEFKKNPKISINHKEVLVFAAQGP
jgi:iron(III) transport system ATP-binding protein